MNSTIRKYQASDIESCKLLWRELTQHLGTHFDINRQSLKNLSKYPYEDTTK